MRKGLLLALADKLRTVENDDYNATDYHKDALFYAAQVPKIKRAGLRLVTRGDEAGGLYVKYKYATDLDAAAELFGLTPIQAQYLFGPHEMDVRGYHRIAPFDTKRDGGRSRENECPAWAAERIAVFVRNPRVDYFTRIAA